MWLGHLSATKLETATPRKHPAGHSAWCREEGTARGWGGAPGSASGHTHAASALGLSDAAWPPVTRCWRGRCLQECQSAPAAPAGDGGSWWHGSAPGARPEEAQVSRRLQVSVARGDLTERPAWWGRAARQLAGLREVSEGRASRSPGEGSDRTYRAPPTSETITGKQTGRPLSVTGMSLQAFARAAKRSPLPQCPHQGFLGCSCGPTATGGGHRDSQRLSMAAARESWGP